jgi:hypothetical protein
VLDFKKRGTHLDTQGFDFVGPCHGTSVVVGQDSDRPVFQFRIEYPFTGNVEIIAVYQGKDGHISDLLDHITDNISDFKDHVFCGYSVHNLIHISLPNGSEG